MTQAVHHSHGPLTLLPPGCLPGQLRLSYGTSDGATGTTYEIWSIRLVSGSPCTLWGTPDLGLLDTAGRDMRYAVTRHWSGPERHDPVLVDRRHPTSFPLAKYRCDTTQPSYDAAIVVTLPNGAGTLRAHVPAAEAGLPFCPRDDGDQRVHVGAIGSWSGRRTATGPVAISLHTSFLPGHTPTWGRADLDGDGHPDTVVVRPSGRVVVRAGGRRLMARAPGRPTDRLQGFTDLTGDGRPEILVGSTTTGCDGGYRLCDTLATVFTLRDGRLRLIRFPDGEPDFDLGVGGVTTGWVCGPDGLVANRVLLTGTTGYRLVRTTYRVTGLVASPVARSVSKGRLSDGAFDELTTTRCAGLSALGWAWERPAASRPLI
ncbi:MAG: VCBS repeat-containing protein [Nocardioides sp.]